MTSKKGDNVFIRGIVIDVRDNDREVSTAQPHDFPRSILKHWVPAEDVLPITEEYDRGHAAGVSHQAVVEAMRETPTDHLLHRLWTKAVGTKDYVKAEWMELDAERTKARATKDQNEIVDLILFCPKCDERHIDVGEFTTKPHHTHACQGCGFSWRPGIVPTRGVQFLPGFKNATKEDADRDFEKDLKDSLKPVDSERIESEDYADDALRELDEPLFPHERDLDVMRVLGDAPSEPLPQHVLDALEAKRLYDETSIPLGPQPRFTVEEEDAIKTALRKAIIYGRSTVCQCLNCAADIACLKEKR